MTAQDNDIEETTDVGGEAVNTAPVHPLAFDAAVYLHYLKEADLSEYEKRELIETLWTIVNLFADYGFGAHPVQQACGQNDDLAAFVADNVLSSSDQSPDHKKKRSGALEDAAPEGSRA